MNRETPVIPLRRPLLTESGLLKDALRQARAVAVLRRVARRQPSAHVVAERLAGWLTDVIPNRWETESLLVTCIREGKRAVEALSPDDDRVFNAWLRGLSQPLPSVLDWRIIHADSGQVWNALGNEPLLLWRLRGSGKLSVSRHPPAERPVVTPDSVRLILMGHLLDEEGLMAIGGHLPRILEGDDA